MTHILVTGGNGQLGSELKNLQTKHNLRFTFIDIKDLDLTDKSAISEYFQTEKFDYCINCAAYTEVDKAESDISIARSINVDAVGYLAQTCNSHSTTLIHISTDFVFDGTSNIPYIETDKVNPISQYGLTKFEGEETALANNKNTLIIRTSWLYSSYGNNFVKTMIRLGKEKDSLNIIFDQIGTPTYAADLAEALLLIIEELIADKQLIKKVAGIYHFSNEGVASWYDFAKEIFTLSSIHCSTFPVRTSSYPTPAKRPHYSVMDKKKIKKIFDIHIKHWKESLSICIDILG